MSTEAIPGDSRAPSPASKLISARLACVILLVIHAILLTWAAAENSATFDEPGHLAAGAVYWHWRDLSMYSLSPPLLRLWAAAPAILAGAQVPDPRPSHHYTVAARHMAYTDDFIYANFARFENLLFLCRLWMIPLSCLTGFLVYLWARELYGPAAALAACALYCFNPSILAHGALVTTDLGTTTAMLLTCWLWWRFCRRPTLLRWVWVCLALTATHLCKFTAILMWPMMLAMAVPYALRGGKRWRVYLAAWAVALPVTLLLINASYGFYDSFRPIGSFNFQSELMQHVQQTLPARFPVPVPGVMLEGFDAQKFDTSLLYPAYLFGQIYDGARWDYYPDALLCKTPVSVLALMLFAGLTLFIRRPNLAPDDYAAPWCMALAPIVFLAGVLIIGDVNIGTRYILPALPFALILTSRLWTLFDNAPKLLRRARDGLVLMAAVEAVAVGPWFISYINFAAGGPDNGWRLLANSDFDWGNGLIALRRWMHDQNVPRVTLVYFGYIDPGAYGIQYDPPGPTMDSVDVVSSFYLQGLPNRIVVAPHQRAIGELPFCLQLQETKPLAVVADTLFIYDANDVKAAAIQYEVLRHLSGH